MNAVTQSPPIAAGKIARDQADERIFDAFRRWGYLEADLDPLHQALKPWRHPELQISGPAADQARSFYTGTLGVEFMHIADPERRQWIQERIESEAPKTEQRFILERLIRADLFEQVLQARYLGTKRFSLEGLTALIPLLDELLQQATAQGAVQAVLGMSHRGRLNVIANIVGRRTRELFAGFEDVDPRSVLGGGDVKYHMGATGSYVTRQGRKIQVHLVSNPSHLEAVDPVVMGRARAKQIRFSDQLDEEGMERVLPVVVHGDAAFAGQGISAETLNFSGLEGYYVGGAVHVIANNLLGFTANPCELHSSRFASDLAKRLPIPIFHVNGEDVDAVVWVAGLALEYRYSFGTDVVIDLIGYRRHGHSEVDDASITQPVLYGKIKEHRQLWQIYAERIGMDAAPLAEKTRAELEEEQRAAKELQRRPTLRELPAYWSKFKGGCFKREYEVETAVPEQRLRMIGAGLSRAPDGFNVHPKIKKLLEQRGEMGMGKKALDFGMAEAMAFGSLLTQGIPVRLSGQDSRRGTFSHRHAVLIDTEDEQEFTPLAHLAADQARFEVYNSELSEAGVLGFEYGYSRDYPEALVLWEAQFGDFANGAQIIMDQFISSGEDKWDLLSGMVLLLPHGYEGQGPEHSSARIERYLQLAAKDNMVIAQPSNAAQYFHLLRRQALRPWRKPLIVFTPKSMLRHPDAASPLSELGSGHFQNVIPDNSVKAAERILIGTGKIGHELRAERKRRKDERTAVLFLEQLFPFPEAELAAALEGHPQAREIIWVQEEPANMGALWFVMPKLKKIAQPRAVRSVKRSASASPATGSGKAHEMEQKTLLTLAFAEPKSAR